MRKLMVAAFCPTGHWFLVSGALENMAQSTRVANSVAFLSKAARRLKSPTVIGRTRLVSNELALSNLAGKSSAFWFFVETLQD